MLKYRIMDTFLLTLFLISSQILPALSGDEEENHDLPFVLIKHKDSFLYPNTIEKGTYTVSAGFLGDTRFSANNHHDQKFFCPPEGQEEMDKINQAASLINSSLETEKFTEYVSLDEKCLLNKTFKKNQNLKCSSMAQAMITKKIAKKNGKYTEIRCGQGGAGTTYQYIYQLCPPITFFDKTKIFFSHIRSSEMRTLSRKIPFLYKTQTLYEICFDHNTLEVIYTRHQLSSLGLLSDPRLQHERSKQFEISTNGYLCFSTVFLTDAKFYEKIENSRKKADSSSSSADEKNADKNSLALPFKPHFLAPPDDMPTALLRKPTFHYINVKPIHEDLLELWNYIEDAIRKNLKDTDIPYDVYTGTFKSSEARYHPKIPDLWVKVVHLNYNSRRPSSGIAILMKTYPDINISFESYCKTDLCSSSKSSGELGRKFSHVMDNFWCCPLEPMIQRLFGFMVPSKLELEIPTLTN